MRLEAARLMLEQGRLPVGTIAAEAGFGGRERMRRSFQRSSAKIRNRSATPPSRWQLFRRLRPFYLPICCRAVIQFDMISRRQFAVFHREDVDGHRLEAFAGRLGPPKFLRGRSGGLATHDDLIAE